MKNIPNRFRPLALGFVTALFATSAQAQLTATAGAAVIFDQAVLAVGFAPIPEPATYGIIGTAVLAVLIGYRRYKSGCE